MKHSSIKQAHNKQGGIALVVGLVMLLVLTIMGISSMSNTTTELKVACNFQTHNDAFQAAMSCIDDSIARVDRAAEMPQIFESQLKGSTATARCEVDYLGCQVVQGSSLKVAAFENVYDIDTLGTASGCGGEAFSHIVQAIAIKTAKACSD